MQYRHLGKSGLLLSAIGLGTNQFGGKVDVKQAAEIIHTAVDLGINFIDTADVYREGRSENFIGQAIQGMREKVLVATKVRHPVGAKGPNDQGASRHHIVAGLEASLTRLGIETIDLYQIHSWDEGTPIEETMRALEDLLRAGKVRYIGASNFSAWQLAQANAVAEMHYWTLFVSIQPHYHMLHREIEKELVPACKYFNIGILPYFPLAGGFLTGKYRTEKDLAGSAREEFARKYLNDRGFRILAALDQVARQYLSTPAAVSLAWLMARPGVTAPIPSARNLSQLTDLIAATKIHLDPPSIEALDRASA